MPSILHARQPLPTTVYFFNAARPASSVNTATVVFTATLEYNTTHSRAYSAAAKWRSQLTVVDVNCMYSGTSPYGHLTSKKTSPLQSPWISPKLYSTVQITPCNKVTSPLRSCLPSLVGDLNSEVPRTVYHSAVSFPGKHVHRWICYRI